MQALGTYKGGRMLFLGLGTGLGSALIVDGVLEPMELAHLPYKKGTYEDRVGEAALDRFGKKKWRRYVADIVTRLQAALEAEDVVVGGGNAKLLHTMPKGVRLGSNANAFVGGYRLWKDHPAGVTRRSSKSRILA
jgi:polyphosphate glucokinase